MRSRKYNALCTSTESLEIREVKAAAITATLSASGVLVVNGTDKQDIVHVVSDSSSVVVQRFQLFPAGPSGPLIEIPVGIVQISVSGRLQGSVQRNQVNSLRLSLGKGDDRVTLLSDLNSTVFGGEGNDLLIGGAGKDTMYGDAGNDKLNGYNGCDVLWGGDGNDRLDGGNNGDLLNGDNGDDVIYGGSGDDQINGGSGRDSMYGQDDRDTLIAIDGAFSDWVDGGNGNDLLWIDSNSLRDSTSNVSSADVVQAVARFQNGADLTLNGDRINDPYSEGYTTHNYSSLRLFASSGPSIRDIKQGYVGDCWLMSAMGELALRNPYVVRSRIVDFGDGTFGVKLSNSFYRIDGDLPVSNSHLAFADFGLENSAWVALYEKAFALHRNSISDRYGDLNSGWSSEAFHAFGLNAGKTDLDVFNRATMANAMWASWSLGAHLTVASVFYARDSVLVSNHVYMVTGFIRSSMTGLVTSITLRNPYGTDGGTLNDGTNDGVVTLTIAQFLRSVRAVELATI